MPRREASSVTGRARGSQSVVGDGAPAGGMLETALGRGAGTGVGKVKGMRAGMRAQMRWRPRSSEGDAGRWNVGGSFLQTVKSARVKREPHGETSEPGIRTLRKEGPGAAAGAAVGGPAR